MRYHRKKNLYSPVTPQELVTSGASHGTTVWLQKDDEVVVSKDREQGILDILTVACMPVEAFRALQKQRRQARAAAHYEKHKGSRTATPRDQYYFAQA